MCRVALILSALFTVAPTAYAEQRYLTGDAVDVEPMLAGPVHLFGGGSNDDTEALQWMIDQVRGENNRDMKLDVVVLRSSGADAYNDFIYALNGVDSVETLVIDNRDDANSEAVKHTVRDAEIIFFAGGDQCNYVRYFKGTEVQKGVEFVYEKGGGVGGSSAGLAIQGSTVYDACSSESAYSPKALANPYYEDVRLTYDFFNWPHMKATITDTHFAARDRMGRLLVFIARQIKDGKHEQVLGLAVDEQTSIVVDQAGLARVMGKGAAYFVLGDHAPEICQPGVPLTYSNFKVWKVTSNGTWDLRNRPTTGYYPVSVEKGKITSDPYYRPPIAMPAHR
jgi:cyanophycinase